jgi:hypothetical protein
MDAQRLGGLQVDGKLHLGHLHNRQFARLLAFQNSPHIGAGLAVGLRNASTLTQQASGEYEFWRLMDGGDAMTQRQCGELFTAVCEECLVRNHQSAPAGRAHAVNSRVAEVFERICLGLPLRQ